MTDQIVRCEQSDLPRDQCAHCGAQPGTDLTWILTPATPSAQVAYVIGELVMPPDPGRPLELNRRPAAGECACGQPTRNQSYGCDDCAGELARFFTAIPWYAEQLDITIIRDRAKKPGGGGAELMWNDHASRAQRRLVALVAMTVRLCERAHVPHQSPDNTGPTEDLTSLSRWLSWRVDGLLNVNLFPHLLGAAMQTERAILAAIDCGPDLLYLGVCTAPRDDQACGGSVYAISGEPTGKCAACRTEWLTDQSRENLYKELDSMLCTAAEIARLSTYLGIPASRDQVRKLVNQWHARGRLAAHRHGDQGPMFRYAEVRTLLAVKYETKDAS